MVAITADLKTKDLALGMAIALHGFHEVRGRAARLEVNPASKDAWSQSRLT